ncbi:MAG: c-type cytochrome [Alphaproteobacteria bacterium]
MTTFGPRSLRHASVGLLGGAVLLGGFGIARAIDEPENVVAYRQNVMKSQAAHITAIVGVVKGEVSFTGHVADHARGLASTARMIPDIFPEGSDVGDTRAKPEIWQQWDEFTAAAKVLEETSTKLVEVAATGDVAAIGAQLQNVGKACGGCHEPFRKPKE